MQTNEVEAITASAEDMGEWSRIEATVGGKRVIIVAEGFHEAAKAEDATNAA